MSKSKCSLSKKCRFITTNEMFTEIEVFKVSEDLKLPNSWESSWVF